MKELIFVFVVFFIILAIFLVRNKNRYEELQRKKEIVMNILRERHPAEDDSDESSRMSDRDIREEMARLRGGQKTSTKPTFELPDGNVITMSNNMCRTPGEILFRPEHYFNDTDTPGIADLVRASISSCEIDVRKKLYQSILLAGGASLMKGFDNRLRNELMNSSLMLNNSNKYETSWRCMQSNSTFLRYGGIASLEIEKFGISLKAVAERQYSIWIGGSIFSTLRCDEGYISKENYDEYGGLGLINRLCPWRPH